MRLGQLSRKYNLSQEEIIKFLNIEEPENAPYHHNSKLSDYTEELIANHFNKVVLAPTEEPEEPVEEDLFEIDQQITQKIELETNAMEAEEHLQRELDPTLPPIQEPLVKEEEEVEQIEEVEEVKEEPKSIESDRLLELLEADENIDLSDYKIIKAPKKELEGLKVLGKIDLPEPKVKAEPDKIEEPKEDSRNQKNDRSQRRKISEEEREKRRLAAKKKKEEYEARQAKRRKAEEIRKKKAQKRANYEKQLQKNSLNKSKVKPDKKEEVLEVEPVQQRQKPTTLLGKLWGWFWHGD